MGKFEERGVALVSVTQSINTSDSMGRLILNVLMSFAQFERELASERTRETISMSRRKGLWTGGRPVLGYDIVDGNLVINTREAELVQWIFARYLAIKSLDALSRELEAQGVRNKAWTTLSGKALGGGRLAKSTLSGLLGNVLYVGRVWTDAPTRSEHASSSASDGPKRTVVSAHATTSSPQASRLRQPRHHQAIPPPPCARRSVRQNLVRLRFRTVIEIEVQRSRQPPASQREHSHHSSATEPPAYFRTASTISLNASSIAALV